MINACNPIWLVCSSPSLNTGGVGITVSSDPGLALGEHALASRHRNENNEDNIESCSARTRGIIRASHVRARHVACVLTAISGSAKGSPKLRIGDPSPDRGLLIVRSDVRVTYCCMRRRAWPIAVSCRHFAAALSMALLALVVLHARALAVP